MKVFWKKTFTPYVALEKVKMCYAGMWKKNWKLEKTISQWWKIVVVFMDLSKAFVMINLSLLLPKQKVYCFSDQALSLLKGCLCHIFQGNTINGFFSNWNQVVTGVHPILGPLFFNIWIFSCLSRNVSYIAMLCSYVVNTPYKSGKNIKKSKTILNWISLYFRNGFMKTT